MRAYEELRLTHPELPAQLREFQVVCLTQLLVIVILQGDILTIALDAREEGHLMCAFPTGYGKSMPMILLGLFMPEGR